MNRIASIMTFAAFSIATLVPSTAVFADSPGQLSNGTSNYEVKNITKNGSYGQSATVACNETVKYSALLANSDYGLLKNLTVKANLASGAISASATNTANATTTVAGTVAVTVTGGGTLAYVPGTTVRISSDGKTNTNLPDGIVSGGVNAGDLNGSTQTFVQFQAKVTCSTPTPTPTPTSPVVKTTVVTELPHTGAGEVILSLLGAGSLTAVIGAYLASRRAHIGA